MKKNYVFILLMYLSLLTDAQNSIKYDTTSNIYLLGDLHLDQAYFNNLEEKTELINKSLLIQKEIVTTLSDSFNLKYILIEAPVCLEYYINRFLDTKHEPHLWFYSGRQYEIGKLRIYSEIHQKHPDIKIKCYDINNDANSIFTLTSLFYITFYENFKDSISVADSFNPRTNKKAFESIYYNSIKHLDISQDVQFIWDLYYGKPYLREDWILKKKLYNEFNSIDDEALSRLESFYGDNFDLFMRLKKSFVSGYKIPKNSLKLREPILFNVFMECINADPKQIYYVDGGLAHMYEIEGFENMKSMLKQKEANVTSIYLYYKDFPQFYPPAWDTILYLDTSIWNDFLFHQIENSKQYIIYIPTINNDRHKY